MLLLTLTIVLVFIVFVALRDAGKDRLEGSSPDPECRRVSAVHGVVCRIEFRYEVCFTSSNGLSCLSKTEDDYVPEGL